MSNEALKPCPFCGGAPILEDHRLVWSVTCDGCPASATGMRAPEPEEEMPDDYWLKYEKSAITAWNRRATLLPQQDGEQP